MQIDGLPGLRLRSLNHAELVSLWVAHDRGVKVAGMLGDQRCPEREEPCDLDLPVVDEEVEVRPTFSVFDSGTRCRVM